MTTPQEGSPCEEILLPAHVDTPNGPSREFVKHAYQLLPPNSGNVVLLHYMGDERAAVSFTHGNAKGLERAHIRTCPSVLRSMENECNHATPATVYRKLVTACLLYTSPSPRDRQKSRMPSSA